MSTEELLKFITILENQGADWEHIKHNNPQLITESLDTFFTRFIQFVKSYNPKKAAQYAAWYKRFDLKNSVVSPESFQQDFERYVASL